jgi:hypothetical protein
MQPAERFLGRDPFTPGELLGRAPECGMQSLALGVVEVVSVVGRYQLDLGAFRQIDGLVQDEAPVTDLGLQTQLHDEPF